MNIKYHVQQFKEDNISFCEVNSVITEICYFSKTMLALAKVELLV